MVVPFLSVLALAAAEPIATGCPDFEIERPHPRSARVVRAADFGFSPTNHLNGAAIRRALAAAKRAGAAGVALEPGTYRCFDDEGVDVNGFTDFTLDGRGARLVFRRPVRKPGEKRPAVDCNFRVIDCTRIVLRDFTCDWDWATMPLGEYARPVAVRVDAKTDNASYVDYELTEYSAAHPHPAFGKPLPLLVCNAMTRDGRSFRANGGGWCNGHTEGYYGAKNLWLGPNRIRVWPCVKDPAQPYLACYDSYFSPAGNRASVRCMQTNTLYRLVNYYYGKGCFSFGRNAHVTVERCAVESVFGAGVSINGAMHHWQFVDFTFGQGEKPARILPVTTTCDAQHVGNSCGWCKYIRCRWNRNLDDTNNFHDGALLAERAGPRGLRAASEVTRGQSAVRVGSRVELFEENYDATGVRGKVLAITNGVYVLDCAVPQPKFDLFVARNGDFASDNILFRDCDFTDGCMRNLFQSSQITIENCLFRRESGSPLRLMVEWTRKWWVEGTRATNIVVRGCRFEENQISNWAVDGVTSEIFCGARLAASGGGHDGTKVPPPGEQAVARVLVEDCSFVNPRGALMHIVSGRNFVFRNNRVRIDNRRPDDPPYRGKNLCTVPGALREFAAAEPEAACEAMWARAMTTWNPQTGVVTGCDISRSLPPADTRDCIFPFRKERGFGPPGVGDAPLICGTALAGLVDKWCVTREAQVAEEAAKVARGVLNLAILHGHPGFVCRGFCADGKSTCALSSRDQYTHWVHGLWRYAGCGMAKPELVEEYRVRVAEVARYMETRVTEAREWNFGLADTGEKDPRGICTMWGSEVWPHEAARLPMIYAAAAAATGDAHWRALYEKFIDRALERTLEIRTLPPQKIAARMPCYSLYQANASLEVLAAYEKDAARRTKIREAMAAFARLAASRRQSAQATPGKTFYGMCWDGELLLTELMDAARTPDAAFAAFLDEAVFRQPAKRCGTCRAAHVMAAYWRARAARK